MRSAAQLVTPLETIQPDAHAVLNRRSLALKHMQLDLSASCSTLPHLVDCLSYSTNPQWSGFHAIHTCLRNPKNDCVVVPDTSTWHDSTRPQCVDIQGLCTKPLLRYVWIVLSKTAKMFTGRRNRPQHQPSFWSLRNSYWWLLEKIWAVVDLQTCQILT